MPITRIIGRESLVIKEIEIGDRFRKDMGDIDELAANIEHVGLVTPIAVSVNPLGRESDYKYILLAGGRRITATMALGLSNIDAVILECDGAVTKIEVELIENTQRKGLTWSEQAKLEKRIYDARTEEDPKWSERKQAAMFGTNQPFVNRRRQMADYLEVFPSLAAEDTEAEAMAKVKRLINNHKASVSAKELEASEDATSDAGEESDVGVDEKERAVLSFLRKAKASYRVGDSLDLAGKVKENSYHFAEVDPPYAIDLEAKRSRIADTGSMDEYNEISVNEYPKFIAKTAKNVYRALRNGSWCVWWFAPTWGADVLDILRLTGFTVHDVPAIWYKGAVGQANNPQYTLGHSYEPFYICRKGSAMLQKPGRSNVFVFGGVPHGTKYHPTQRPLDMMKEILDTFCPPKGHTIVPFMGSGVTALAALLTDRGAVGWDLSKVHQDHYLFAARRLVGKEEEEEKDV